MYVVGRKVIDLVSKKQPYTTELDTFVSRFQRIEDDTMYTNRQSMIVIIIMINSTLVKNLTDIYSISTAYDEVYFHVKSLACKMKIDQLPMAYAFRCLTDVTLAMGVS